MKMQGIIDIIVDLGHVLSEPGLQQPHPRNGPSRQRRRERRAAARHEQTAAEEVAISDVKALKDSSASKSTEEVEKIDASTSTTDVVEKATEAEDSVERTKEDKEISAEEATILVKEPKDEVCQDDNYTEPTKNIPKPTPSTFRGLGGVDYYTLTYEDYSDDSE